ncbi:NAD(P)-binding protein [Annulohypoxylon maeteangense]|uniref:NAD(P)-binding protein n=1 Tax=Annulohypoxylon maeteangense TaxID=1927788 RepID=UPI0020072AF9|nr:NAD(P)-binding protein [Annulohypoxylon maeteangense]KAI0890469.1 NAD(P)-binding protein [Annulohypoxylon maeteangense]
MDVTGNAFVTGGGSGIGKAACLALAKEGASGILVVDINVKAAEATAAEAIAIASNPSFRAEAFGIDVSVEESVKKAVAHMVQSFERIDYCVHCAGITVQSATPMAEASFSEFQTLVTNHVHGTFLVNSHILAVMKTQELKPVDTATPYLGGTRGSVVNLGSVLATWAAPGFVPYIASKHAVLGISRTAAIDHAGSGIRVNCVCPTWVDTPLFDRSVKVIPGLDRETALSGIPMNRLCTAKEVSDAILFLCGTRSSFITGIALPVDGGHDICRV